MARPNTAICFHCGQDAESTLRLNRLPDGRPCPSCADRLLAALPPVLPAFREEPEPEPRSEGEDTGEAAEFGPDYDRPA
ncbi:MAG: hypothetical protein IT454_23580 [Planctomycetes bacterium]|nr:hypothetical protein [Planctomycetota bacterium]